MGCSLWGELWRGRVGVLMGGFGDYLWVLFEGRGVESKLGVVGGVENFKRCCRERDWVYDKNSAFVVTNSYCGCKDAKTTFLQRGR